MYIGVRVFLCTQVNTRETYLYRVRVSLGTPVSYTNKTGQHHITEIHIVEIVIKHHNPDPQTVHQLSCKSYTTVCMFY